MLGPILFTLLRHYESLTIVKYVSFKLLFVFRSILKNFPRILALERHHWTDKNNYAL